MFVPRQLLKKGRAPVSGWLKVLLLALLLPGAAQAQLSGTYTVCASGCDYSTIQGAADDLMNNGVSGDVTFNIAADTYDEAIWIGYSGSSKYNVTFKGAGPGKTVVAPSSAYIVLQLDYMNNVRFEDMEFLLPSGASYNIYMYESSDIQVNNCRLIAGGGSKGNYCYNIYQEYSSYCTFENNVIRGGNMGIYSYQNNWSYYNYGWNIFKNNRITKQADYGIYQSGPYANLYEGNYFDSLSNGYGYPVYSEQEGAANYRNNIIVGNGADVPFQIYDPQYLGVYEPFLIENNIIRGASNNWVGMYIGSYYVYGVDFHIRHNTIHMPAGNVPLYIDNYGTTGLDIRNNSFSKVGAGEALNMYTASSGDMVDGNNYANGGGSIIYYNMSYYSDLASYKKAAAVNGHGAHCQNMTVTYVSSTDLHYDQTVPAPAAPYADIDEDIDGDSRCKFYPTVGADENNFGKGAIKAKFFGPTTVYVNSPTTFTNAAKVGEPKIHKWYINGVFQTDSIHLYTTNLTGPTSDVKLVTEGCGGKDSITVKVTVQTPPKVPVTDFLASRNIIKQGEVVRFNDLSTIGPSQWSWKITPIDAFDDAGNKVAAFKYIWGNDKTPNNEVRFLEPGKYKVCLTASNVKGAGNTECKVDYIEVIPSINLGSKSVVRNPQGFLYDDGGPLGNYGGYRVNKILLDPCADSVYLVFNQFDLNCGYGMMRIWEGKDNKGKEITPCKNNKLWGNTSGYTGGPSSNTPGCAASCMPDTKRPDTIKAAKYMYIEMDASYNWQSAGFEAYWWSKPRQQNKPTAKLEFSADSVCTEGSVLFTNASTGDDISLLWDLDPNEPGFEDNGTKPTSWTYFMPGNYEIMLVATNCGGSDTFRKTLKVFDPQKPTGDFKADNVNPTTNDVVFFKSSSITCVTNYNWTFTSQVDAKAKVEFVGNTSATSANPQVIFPVKGCWDVKLEAGNVTGTATKTEMCYITVKDAYCQPSVATLIGDLGISNVSFAGISNASAQGAKEYGNYITTKAANVELGGKYKLTMERTTAKNPMNRSVFIDWNADGDFDDPQELYAEELAAKTLSWSVDITIPAFASKGATVMRLATNIGAYSNKACGQNEYGEYEDYRLYITNDITPPVITLVGNEVDSIEQGNPYVDKGTTATDNQDGNITANVVRTSNPTNFNTLIPATYKLKYDVSDKAGNKAESKYRIVVVGPDKTAPDLQVMKPDTIFVHVGGSYKEPLVMKAMDLVDGDVSGSVSKSKNVDVSKVDTYKVVYSVTDFSGNTAVVDRYVVVYDSITPNMSLKGADTVYVPVYSLYNDLGVNFNDNYYTTAQLGDALNTTSNVDITRLGTYSVTYVLSDLSHNGPVTRTRTVIVGDFEKPTLGLKGDTVVVLNVKDKYKEDGLSISDNFWQNLKTWETEGTYYQNFKDGIATKTGSYTIIYKVTDGSGNINTITRYVDVVDIEAPVLTLKGSPAVSICRWKDYVDAGYTWSDNYHTSIVDIKIDTMGDFLTGRTTIDGLYNLRYRAVDKAGNVGYSAYRYILVLSASSAECVTAIGETGDLGNHVSVYPNPNTGRFAVKVEMPQMQQMRIGILDALGREISLLNNGSLQSGTFEVDLSTQPSGIYTLTVTTPQGTTVKRISVNH